MQIVPPDISQLHDIVKMNLLMLRGNAKNKRMSGLLMWGPEVAQVRGALLEATTMRTRDMIRNQ